MSVWHCPSVLVWSGWMVQANSGTEVLQLPHNCLSIFSPCEIWGEVLPSCSIHLECPAPLCEIFSFCLPSDFHPDLGMVCSSYYAQESWLLDTRWRGVVESARHKKDLVQEHTLYVKVNTKILYKNVLLFPNEKPQLKNCRSNCHSSTLPILFYQCHVYSGRVCCKTHSTSRRMLQ